MDATIPWREFWGAGDCASQQFQQAPKDLEFKTKSQSALDRFTWACDAGLPRGVALIDAGYGVETKFWMEISALDLRYLAGVKTTTVWAPEMARPQTDDPAFAADRCLQADPLRHALLPG